jgi:hypothetical protein
LHALAKFEAIHLDDDFAVGPDTHKCVGRVLQFWLRLLRGKRNVKIGGQNEASSRAGGRKKK